MKLFDIFKKRKTRNDILNEINQAKSQFDLQKQDKKILEFLENESDWNLHCLIMDNYKKKFKRLEK